MTAPAPDWLVRYRDEVLRWNASINLVSRRDTVARLDALLAQCDDAGRRLLSAHPLAAPVLYLDLGAGGGLPGVPWHGLLHAAGLGPASWLVEPREKRAWFLERVARALPPGCGVLQGAWGDVAPPAPVRAASILLSLKALRLDDGQVLAGLAPFAEGPARVTIARFHPHDQRWSQALAAGLAIPAPGEEHPSAPGAVLLAAGLLPAVGPEGASLVVSRYDLRAG